MGEVTARVKRKLERLTSEREMSLPNLLTLWEAFDKVCSEVGKGDLSDEEGKIDLLQILEKVTPKVTP